MQPTGTQRFSRRDEMGCNMAKFLTAFWLAAGVVAACATGAFAQAVNSPPKTGPATGPSTLPATPDPADDGGGANVGDRPMLTPDAVGHGVFRFNRHSGYFLASNGPVPIPPMTAPPGLGTLVIRPTVLPLPSPTDPRPLRAFSVSDFNGVFTTPDSTAVYITGSGRYQLFASVGPLAVLGHRMTLTLRVGNAGDVVYDSGLVPLTTPLSAAGLTAVDVTVLSPATNSSARRMAIRVAANLVSPQEIRPYIVQSRTSAFVQGCYDPCLCPIRSVPLTGRFGLVALPGPGDVSASRPSAYALVGMNLVPLEDPQTNSRRGWIGTGILRFYRLNSTNEPRQQLVASLLPPPDPNLPSPQVPRPVRFDSGVAQVTAAFPGINVSIANNGFVCFNTVFQIDATPVP